MGIHWRRNLGQNYRTGKLTNVQWNQKLKHGEKGEQKTQIGNYPPFHNILTPVEVNVIQHKL